MLYLPHNVMEFSLFSACGFGDRFSWCATYIPTIVPSGGGDCSGLADYWRDQCCMTCAVMAPEEPDWCAQSFIGNCYNEEYAQTCKVTCQRHRNDSAENGES